MKVIKRKKCEAQIFENYNIFLDKWQVNYEERDIVNHYGRTHVVLAGNQKNKPLLLFHGVGDNSAIMWVYNMKALTEYFYCITIDTIGGPGKSKPGKGYNRDFNQQVWMHSIIQALGIEHCYVAGVSNGAVMAMAYALYNPNVDKVICIEGCMVLSKADVFKTFVVIFPEILWPTRQNMLKLLDKFAHPRAGFFEEHSEIADYMILIMKAHNQMAMKYQSPSVYDSEKVKLIKSKLHFIFGEYATGKNTALKNKLDRDELGYTIIKSAGHGVNMEQSEQVNQLMINILTT